MAHDREGEDRTGSLLAEREALEHDMAEKEARLEQKEAAMLEEAKLAQTEAQMTVGDETRWITVCKAITRVAFDERESTCFVSTAFLFIFFLFHGSKHVVLLAVKHLEYVRNW